MKWYQCTECDKSFRDASELYNHIENNHRQIPIATEKKCPNCENKEVLFCLVGKDGQVSFATGEIEGEEYLICFCENCKTLYKIKSN